MSDPKPSQPSPGRKSVVLTRTFAAPRELVFDVWTKEEHLKKWFAPTGCTVRFASADLRPGGVFLYGFVMPNGAQTWGKWTFREIKRPEKLVLVNSFADAEGNAIRHPMAPTWPLETLSTSTFTEKDGRTTLRLEWAPINASDEELQTFFGAEEGMNAGWNGTFLQLDAYLKIV